ncbi:MAG TPA: hypothetical protein VF490_07315 [Chryseosolibacter sp.]
MNVRNMADDVPTGVFTGGDFNPSDMPAGNWVPLGKSRKIDCKSVFQKGREIGVKWYILEMDRFDGTFMRRSIHRLLILKKRDGWNANVSYA